MATLVEVDPKAPFSIDSTPTCKGGGFHFTLDHDLIMLSVKQGSIKYHFLSLWYDSTCDWTQVFRAIGEYSDHYANVRCKKQTNKKQKQKHLYGCMEISSDKQTISHTRKLWYGWEKVSLKRETESILIATENDAIRTNYIKAKIDKALQRRKCWLCGDRDETINHIINECWELAQRECKTRHDSVRKVIYFELCKRLKFDHTNKWNMCKHEAVIENETPKILRDFGLVWFYGISTTVSCLMPNPFKKYKRFYFKQFSLA